MDDQNPIPPEPVVQPPPPEQVQKPLSMPLLLGLGAVLLAGLTFFYFFYQNTFLAGQIDKSLTVTDSPTPAPTQVVEVKSVPTLQPSPLVTPRPTHTTLYAEDTVSIIVPPGWKDTSTPPLTMAYTATNGDSFSIRIAPNTPIMSARERMDEYLHVTSETEPYYEHVPVGNRYGLSYDNTTAYAYFVADDKYYWEILFKCKEDCYDQRNQVINSMIFRTP